LRKGCAFPVDAATFSPLAKAGRLSLPAFAEEVFLDGGASERQSLSAKQAAKPQVIAQDESEWARIVSATLE
jgi:hypothetical protein